MSTHHKHYIIGYGSLLSHDSRKRFSNLDISPVHVKLHGWQREWQVNSPAENQTYVGVQPNEKATLNAALIPTTSIDTKLQQREKDYEFVQVAKEQIEFLSQMPNNNLARLNESKLWICRPKSNDTPNKSFPVNQSYVDTCLAGALESGLDGYAEEFIHTTVGWHHHWVNDRHRPKYPRAAAICTATLSQIDMLLDKCKILHHRIES